MRSAGWRVPPPGRRPGTRWRDRRSDCRRAARRSNGPAPASLRRIRLVAPSWKRRRRRTTRTRRHEQQQPEQDQELRGRDLLLPRSPWYQAMTSTIGNPIRKARVASCCSSCGQPKVSVRYSRPAAGPRRTARTPVPTAPPCGAATSPREPRSVRCSPRSLLPLLGAAVITETSHPIALTRPSTHRAVCLEYALHVRLSSSRPRRPVARAALRPLVRPHVPGGFRRGLVAGAPRAAQPHSTWTPTEVDD